MNGRGAARYATLRPFRSEPAIQSALLRYRVLATAVGVALVLIVIAIPFQIAGHAGFEKSVATFHGWVLFPLYLLASFDLSRRVRWSIPATVSVLVAGVVPVGSFYVERRVRHNVEAGLRRSPGRGAGAPAQTVRA